ncbi:MAG: 50S ribosomal protein L11 methyltransferase [Clostridia bacterium]|nr:50S ribosomal protein L11 methyltransferase [Clostridia bacterium]
MNWTEIKISVSCAEVEKAAAIANMTVPYGIYIEDYSDLEPMAKEIAHIDLIDEGLINKDREKAIIHIYISEEDNPNEAISYLSERFTAEEISHIIDSSLVAETDWAENWKKYFKPVEIGNRLAVCPTWEKYDNKDNRTVLSIDPGAAFGTGTHDTTKLCLTVLDSVILGGETLLDIGCGSGILAISSVILGTSYADGVDIDAMAVRVAAENAEINGVEDKTNFICGDLTEKISGKYDIICANIVADVIIQLCKNVTNFMVDDGIFVCSGIVDIRENEVAEAIKANGMKIIARHTSGGWVAFVAERN